MDIIIVVFTNYQIQKLRLLKRKGWNLNKIQAICDRQISDTEKKINADFIINTNVPINSIKNNIYLIMKQIYYKY